MFWGMFTFFIYKVHWVHVCSFPSWTGSLNWGPLYWFIRVAKVIVTPTSLNTWMNLKYTDRTEVKTTIIWNFTNIFSNTICRTSTLHAVNGCCSVAGSCKCWTVVNGDWFTNWLKAFLDDALQGRTNSKKEIKTDDTQEQFHWHFDFGFWISLDSL